MPCSARPTAEEGGVAVQCGSRVIVGLDAWNAFEPPIGDCRRQGRGEDQVTTAIDEIFLEQFRTADIGAVQAEGFAAGVDGSENAVAQALLVDATGSVCAEAAGAVCLIDNNVSTVAFGQFDDVRERGRVAIHAEKRFGDDEHLPTGGPLGRFAFQAILEMIQIVVAKQELAAAGPGVSRPRCKRGSVRRPRPSRPAPRVSR